jgi:hypothetical protein
METKTYQSWSMSGGEAEYVCEVRIQSQKNPVLLDCELEYTFVPCSREPGFNYRESIVSPARSSRA